MFDLFRKPLKVIRTFKGSYVAGYWVDGSSEDFNINASVQATDAEVIQALPEGQRTSLSYTLITDKLLKVSTGDTSPDVVIIDDERFLVSRVTSWQNLYQTKHHEVVVVRENIDKIK
jgi:hypothetical protein